jgi:superoxide reductase
MKFYRCSHCGNIITFLEEKTTHVSCCGQRMEELIVNSKEASLEKHVPFVKVVDNNVSIEVGSIIHPSTVEHHIAWIAIQTNKTVQIKYLENTEKPSANFILADSEKLIKAYAYCNLHGLWSN